MDSTLGTVREFTIFLVKASTVSSLLWILQEAKKEADFPQKTELTSGGSDLQNLMHVPSPSSKVLYHPEVFNGRYWRTCGSN